MMDKLIEYNNGNYHVTIYENGTKVRENDLDCLIPDRPESMDLKITNKCPMNCPVCHERSVPNGEHGDIMNLKFIDTLPMGMEIALGGGAVTGHPDLIPFLEKLKSKMAIPSITVHQVEYMAKEELINRLIENKLVYGIGISFSRFDDEFWDKVLKNSNVVVHLILGYHSSNVFEYFANKQAKVLILGYKNFGRGQNFYSNKEQRQKIENGTIWVEQNFFKLVTKYKTMSFDNLALEQLHVKSLIPKKQWDTFYQGDDGSHTFYVDGVKEQFAKTSTSTERFELKDNIIDMFNVIKEVKNDD